MTTFKPDTLVQKDSVSTEDIKEIENRESFLKRLEDKFTPEQIEDIDFAYDLAKESHRPQLRDSGERYFEHPRAGCLIMMDELGMYDYNLIISFLLHDTGEDIPIWGNVTESYDQFVVKAKKRLSKVFNDRIADIVIKLTKPSVDNIKFFTKDEAFNFYINQMQTDEDVVIGKMVDRLHNLRNLVGNKPEKIQRQISETEEVYIPLFEKITGKNKQYAEQLLEKIKDQLLVLKSL